MSERNGLRYGLLGLALIVLLGVLAFIANRPATTTVAETAAPAAAQGLQSLAELSGKAPTRRTLDIQSWKTAEGAKVLFVAAPELPMFDLRLTFAAGSSQDGDIPGLATLTNAMLNEGVAGKDVTAIAEGFESLGAEFGNGAYRDMAIASLRSLTAPEQRQPALELFTQVVGAPTFPEDSLARIKNQMLAGFEYQKQNPGKLAGLELFRRLYGDHPYAHSSDGNEKSIPKITTAQLRAFHQKGYAAGNVVIALVGDLTREQAESIANRVSQSLPKGPALPAPAEPALFLPYGSLGAQTRASDANLYPVLNRRRPVDVWAYRKDVTTSWQVVSVTAAAMNSVETFYALGGPIFLQLDPSYGWPDRYYQPGNVDEGRLSGDMTVPFRVWSAPLTVIDAPPGRAQGTAENNWCAVEDTYPTWADMTATGMTWAEVVAGAAVSEDGYGFGPYGDGPYGDGG